MSAPESTLPRRVEGRPRRVVLVAGSGRSGTSAMAGTLVALGLQVPQPEVRADNTNPKGFGEPRWVVGLHDDLLNRANVRLSDARPEAGTAAADVVGEPTRHRVAVWLLARFEDTGAELVVKDPRLLWFLPLWQSAALRCEAEPSVITMLRPVPEVAGSKRTYNHRSVSADASTVAGWVNTMLTCEHATRGLPRAFVRYHDLLSDWRAPVMQLGERFGLDGVRGAGPGAVRAVDAFLDPSLRRVQKTWDDLVVPPRLREIAEATWDHLDRLVEPAADGPAMHRTLDEVRTAYVEYYRECAGVARATAVAAQRARRPTYRVSRLLPYTVRKAVRPQLRRVVSQVSGRRDGPGQG